MLTYLRKRIVCAILGHSVSEWYGIIYTTGWCDRCERRVDRV